jgi:hypothetical protein
LVAPSQAVVVPGVGAVRKEEGSVRLDRKQSEVLTFHLIKVGQLLVPHPSSHKEPPTGRPRPGVTGLT